MMRQLATAAFMAAALAGATPAAAQQTAAPLPLPDDTTAVVDRVLAVVGNDVILRSQVDEEIFKQQGQGMPLPTDPDSLHQYRQKVLSDLIDESLLVQQAERDTAIHVTDQDVAEAVDQQVRYIRRQLPSELEYKNELRKAGFQTPEEYRRWLSEDQRKQLLRQKYIAKLEQEGKLDPVQPTDAEMRQYFEEQKASLPEENRKRPATITWQQIVLAPQPSDSARERSRRLADSIVTALRGGADFATAAKRFSDDPGTRDKGGELGWFRREAMIPEFSRVAFLLRPGQISDPVESPFGFHIIQVQRAQPTEVQARHILIMPEITQGEADSARAMADSIAALVRSGASVDSLQRIYHDRSEVKNVEDVPVDNLPEAYAKALADADSGQVLVVPIPAQPATRTKYAVVLVGVRTPPGEITYQDYKDQIRSALAKDLAVRRFIARLRASNYVEVRPT